MIESSSTSWSQHSLVVNPGVRSEPLDSRTVSGIHLAYIRPTVDGGGMGGTLAIITQ